jgi:hypothetical protein
MANDKHDHDAEIAELRARIEQLERGGWPRAAGEDDPSAAINAEVAAEIGRRANKPIRPDWLVTPPSSAIIWPGRNQDQ